MPNGFDGGSAPPPDIMNPARGDSPFFGRRTDETWTLAGRLAGLALQFYGGTESLEGITDECEQMDLPFLIGGGSRSRAGFAIQEGYFYLQNYRLDPQGFPKFNFESDAPKLASMYNLCREGEVAGAVALLILSLRHPSPHVRTVAAACLHPLLVDEETRYYVLPPIAERVETALFNAAAHQDRAVRDLAMATGTPPLPPPPIAGASADPRHQDSKAVSLLAHGTAAYKGDWWRPHGIFHSYLINGPKPNLFNDPAPWYWNGGIDAHSRRQAARDLADWTASHGFSEYDTLMGHSYGGGVILMATQYGVKADNIVLLSTPARNYEPRWGNFRNVLSLRIKFDLVLAIDAIRHGFSRQALRQRFSDPRITELPTLPIWFKRHGSTHDPDVWEECSVPEMLWP